jgi:hypothetical protein
MRPAEVVVKKKQRNHVPMVLNLFRECIREASETAHRRAKS